MILDSLENSRLSEKLNPYLAKVFDFIKTHDLTAMPAGKIEIDGENAWISVDEVMGRDKKNAKLETHDKYLDVQILLCGVEYYGWKPRNTMAREIESYSSVKDITFYGDEPEFYFTLAPGEFVIFFPGDGHAPCVGDGQIKKAVAKVRVL